MSYNYLQEVHIQVDRAIYPQLRKPELTSGFLNLRLEVLGSLTTLAASVSILSRADKKYFLKLQKILR